jgi:GAF domain-containing protein
MAKEIDDNQILRDQLNHLVQTIELTGRAILPTTNEELLQTIIEAAARIFGAAAASMALVDPEDQSLVFRVATGEGNEDLIGKRIPLETGLAGYVAMTGQPLAIADVQEDLRFNKEFAKSTGYVPKSILATPLIWNDRVIGVMEVLDKIDEASFGMQDMELLGIFAKQAAIAIYHSQQYESLSFALLSGLQELGKSDPETGFEEIFNEIRRIHGYEVEENSLYEIADCIHKLGMVGEDERQACLAILRTFDSYISTHRLYMYS